MNPIRNMVKAAVMLWSMILKTAALPSSKQSTQNLLRQMESDCDAALQQIEEKMYAKEYEDEYDHILCYGIAFFQKALSGSGCLKMTRTIEF